jgi:hypothetical protein
MSWDNPFVFLLLLFLLYVGVSLMGKIFGWEKKK